MASKAQQLSSRQRGAVIGAVRRMKDPFRCEHGHLGCSNTEWGPCRDECMALNAKPQRQPKANATKAQSENLPEGARCVELGHLWGSPEWNDNPEGYFGNCQRCGIHTEFVWQRSGRPGEAEKLVPEAEAAPKDDSANYLYEVWIRNPKGGKWEHDCSQGDTLSAHRAEPYRSDLELRGWRVELRLSELRKDA